MEKVKITKEQEEALESWMIWCNEKNYNALDQFVNSGFRGSWNDVFKPLNEISPQEFSLILNGWYEVEQPFEVGEWIFSENDGKYYKVSKDFNTDDDRSLSLEYVNDFSSGLVKVSEPWKIKLLELGRKKPELMVGDVVVDKYGAHVVSERVFNVKMATEWANQGKVKVFFPVEKGIEVKNR